MIKYDRYTIDDRKKADIHFRSYWRTMTLFFKCYYLEHFFDSFCYETDSSVAIFGHDYWMDHAVTCYSRLFGNAYQWFGRKWRNLSWVRTARDNFEVPITKRDNIKHVWYSLLKKFQNVNHIARYYISRSCDINHANAIKRYRELSRNLKFNICKSAQ